MSASDKKKLRKEQNATAMTEKQKAEQKKQSTTKAYTLTFVVAMVLVVVLVLCAVLQTPVTGLIWNSTNAATVNGESISAAELNYFYYDAINKFYSNFSSYGDYTDFYIYYSTGLRTTQPLDEQIYDKESNKTWADFFVESAVDNAKWAHVMYDAAMADKNFKLSEDEQKSLDSMDSYYKLYASLYGYSNKDAYIRAMYGDGASYKSFSEYSKMVTIAGAFANKYFESLSFDGPALDEYESDKMKEYNSYSYYLYYIDADKYLTGGTEVKGEDGKTTITYSDEEKEAAVAAALADAKMLAESGAISPEEFDKLVAGLSINIKDEEETKGEYQEKTTDTETTDSETTDGETSDGETSDGETSDGETTDGETSDDETTEEEYTIKHITAYLNQLYSVLESSSENRGMKEITEWVSNSDREEHNMVYLPYVTTDANDKQTTEGYYVLYYSGSTDNTEYKVGTVRHLLVAFEKDDKGNLKPDADATAKAEAEELLAEFKAGEMTEEKFTELLTKHTDDVNSSTKKPNNDGLYADITPDSGYSTAFWQWACAEHKEGDVEIISTEHGYHIMYYVSCDELNYRDTLIHADMVSEAYEEWEDSLLKDVTAELVNDKFIERDMTLAG